MEQLVARVRDHRGGQQRVDIDGARRLSHQRDIARIATESIDVAVDELERLDDVEQGEVAGILLRIRAGLELRHIQEAEDAKAVVHRHDNGMGRLGEGGPVVDRVCRIA